MLKVIRFSMLIVVLSIGAVGCSTVSTSERGSATPRLAVIMGISEYLKMPITLQLETSSKYQNWAYLSGFPLTLEGNHIDYRLTPLAKDFEEGFVDDNFAALVRYIADGSAEWQLVELSVGATDAPFVGWLEQYGLPASLIENMVEKR
jgi:hypothetical protein